MIDLKKLRENTSIIREAAKAKNVEIDFTRVLELDKLVRAKYLIDVQGAHKMNGVPYTTAEIQAAALEALRV